MKLKAIAVLLLVSLLLTPVQAAAADTRTVNVSVPEFSITVNGQTMDNKYAQYPFLVYNGITYLPMTYRMNQFAGLKFNWYNNDYYHNTLFVGLAAQTSEQVTRHVSSTANTGSYTAVVLDCAVYANTNKYGEFFDNKSQTYPLLRFRDINYIPLTWDLAVNTLGWKYSFDNENGLVIDTTARIRPIINDRHTFVGGPGSGVYITYYCIFEDAYVGYPNSTWSENYTFTVMKFGQEEKQFSVQDQLTGGDYYLNSQISPNGYAIAGTDFEPTLEGDIFTIHCVRQTNSARQNVLVKVDIERGEIISVEEMS